MKIFITLLLSVTLATNAFAFFDGPLEAPSTGKLVNPTHEYELDTWGSNSEVYEFTPRSNTNKTCVFVMLDNAKAMSMQCFDKPIRKTPTR